MKINNNVHTNLSPKNFSARCPQIRDADWVCRVINETLPHFSTTKHQPRIINFLKKNRNILKYEKTPKTLIDVYKIITGTKIPAENTELRRMLSGILRTVVNLGSRRLETESVMGQKKLYDALFLTEVFRVGNCSENAALAELVLKMNNIHNACCASLHKGLKGMSIKDWKNLDHCVCVFNRNGAPFNEKVTKNTIIVDPWIGKAGFAKDMERFYRNELSRFFKLDADEVFKYKRMDFVDIPDIAMEKLKGKYEPFIFKNEKRKFMQ